MKLIAVILIVLALVWIGYNQDKNPLPRQTDPKPSQIVNLPDDLKSDVGLDEAPADENTITVVPGNPATAAPIEANPEGPVEMVQEPTESLESIPSVIEADDATHETDAHATHKNATESVVDALEQQLDEPVTQQ